MKKFVLVLLFLVCSTTFSGCKKKAITYRFYSLSYQNQNEIITLTQKDIKDMIHNNYKPEGDIADNYFFCLKLLNESEGQAIFVYSELGEEFVDVIADTFSIENKPENKITFTFSNGSTLSGYKSGKFLHLSGNGINYIFQKTN